MHIRNESMANKLVYTSFLLAVSDGLNSIQVAFLQKAFPRRLLYNFFFFICCTLRSKLQVDGNWNRLKDKDKTNPPFQDKIFVKLKKVTVLNLILWFCTEHWFDYHSDLKALRWFIYIELKNCYLKWILNEKHSSWIDLLLSPTFLDNSCYNSLFSHGTLCSLQQIWWKI